MSDQLTKKEWSINEWCINE